MSVYLRPGSPYYQTEFVVQGTRIRRSTGATTRREALAIERRFRAQERERLKQGQQPADLTLSQAFGKYWLDHACELGWAHEVRRYLSQILDIIDPDLLLRDLSDAEVDAFVQARRATGGGRYAINRALAVWSGVHNMARRRWKQPTQVIDWSQFKSSEKKRVDHITPAQAVALIEALPEHIAQIVEWLLLTGCRRNEAFDLLWSDIDMDARTAEIRVKGGKQHRLYLNAHALALLSRIPPDRPRVFDTTNWRKHFARGCRVTGLDGLRWHDLRHTHATWLRQAGAPLEVVQRSLGHEQVATTTRYAHVADHELRDALHRLPTLSTHTQGAEVVRLGKERRISGGAND